MAFSGVYFLESFMANCSLYSDKECSIRQCHLLALILHSEDIPGKSGESQSNMYSALAVSSECQQLVLKLMEERDGIVCHS